MERGGCWSIGGPRWRSGMTAPSDLYVMGRMIAIRWESRARRGEKDGAEALFSSASDDEIGGYERAMREQLQRRGVPANFGA